MKLTTLSEDGMRQCDWDPAKGPPGDLSDYSHMVKTILSTTPQRQTIAPGPTTERLFIQLYYWSQKEPQYAHLFRKLSSKLSEYGFGGQYLLKKLDRYIERDTKRAKPKLKPRQKPAPKEEEDDDMSSQLHSWVYGNR
jgi:hypothetical protein